LLLRLRHFVIDIIGALLVGIAVFFLLSGNNGHFPFSSVSLSPRLLDVKTLFLSILLEAIPFVLLGVFFSALIQTFVKDEQVRRWTPRNVFIALPFAALLGFLFPVCECAIVPIVRRFIQKGMPAHIGIVFMLAGPVVNPVVMAATYTAFQRQPEMVIERSLLALAVAILTGLLLWMFHRQNPLKLGADRQIQHEIAHAEARTAGIGATFRHAVDEFFDMGKFLIFGALVSSILQVYFSRETLASIGQTPLTAHLAMMGLGYVFSLCSEADAFIAASFAGSFSKSSLLAFLVFGPMIDLKNTLMLFSVFRFSFVVKLIAIVTVLVLTFTLWLPL
jgi:uncharacterized membrane protein YraQ (UPF0718 family)